MLKIHKEPTGEGAVVLKLEGDATIENAEQLHQAVLEALQEADHLLLDCEQVTSCDFYALQMLCSAHRTSIKWDKQFTFHGVQSTAVEEAIRATGFMRKHACTFGSNAEDCMWIGQINSSTK